MIQFIVILTVSPRPVPSRCAPLLPTAGPPVSHVRRRPRPHRPHPVPQRTDLPGGPGRRRCRRRRFMDPPHPHPRPHPHPPVPVAFPSPSRQAPIAGLKRPVGRDGAGRHSSPLLRSASFRNLHRGVGGSCLDPSQCVGPSQTKHIIDGPVGATPHSRGPRSNAQRRMGAEPYTGGSGEGGGPLAPGASSM